MGRFNLDDRLFIGVYPTGVVYADRTRERHGDYVRLAFLPFDTLALLVEADCPLELRVQIQCSAAHIQARKGEDYQVSTCGQTVRLGSAIA